MRAGLFGREAEQERAEPALRAGLEPMSALPAAAGEWDAGDLACGELVLELRRKLRRMPGGVLKVTATDPSAPVDLPAWCRLTNNELVHHDAESKSYWIKSRMNWN